MRRNQVKIMSAIVPALLFIWNGLPAMAADGVPNIAGQTIEEVAERTGYTPEEIREYFPPIETWGTYGVEPAPEKIAESFARDRFSKVPPPGVHPRIYFGPDDLPRLRRHFQESKLARVQLELMRGRLLQMSPDREDWEGIDVNRYEEYLAQGIRINRRMGYHGPWVGGWVNELAQGKEPEALAGHWDKNIGQTGRQYLMHLMPWEALRCLIDDDQAGGRRLAAALVTVCELFGRHMDQYGPSETNWQRVYQNLGSHSIGLTYDWGSRWMDDAQRAKVRHFISQVTRGKDFIGLDQVPAYPGNTTNWITIHMTLMPMVLSIEGEEGYDPLVYERCVEGLRKWVFVASGPQGAPFEGYNKSSYAPQWLFPLAKRDAPFIGSEYSKNVVRRYALHTMLPWGRQHVWETGLGLMRDTIPFKYAHPNDPVVDLIFAATVEEALSPDSRPIWPNIRTTYAPSWEYVFIQDDPIGATTEGYDYDRRFDEVMTLLRETNEPLTYYSDYRGVMTSRSGWNRDAMMLYFEPRNIPGGHTRGSRNEFVLAGLGRLWATRTEAVSDGSDRHSVILINGVGQGHQCPPGRTIAVEDSPAATFAAGDARWAYSHKAAMPPKPGATTNVVPMPISPNDSRLEPGPLPWMSQPWSFLPAWNTGIKGGDRHSHWAPHQPVEYAYRTVGMVRGPMPYAIVIDDVRKDDAEHLYEWLMQTPADLMLVEKTAAADGNGAFDVILGEKEGDRRLLLRVLQVGRNEGQRTAAFGGTVLEEYTLGEGARATTDSRLRVPLNDVIGAFKVMLLPHRKGQPLPAITFNGETLTVEWPDRLDELTFALGPDGRTRVTLVQDGKTTVNVK